jgi:hypothetical protein
MTAGELARHLLERPEVEVLVQQETGVCLPLVTPPLVAAFYVKGRKQYDFVDKFVLKGKWPDEESASDSGAEVQNG